MTDDRDTALLERELRTTLHRLADAHDPVDLPRDLWQQGRAPQPRKHRLDLVAAAVVLVALLASLVLVTRPDVVVRPAQAPEGGALPTDVWLPDASEMSEGHFPPLDGVGPVSVATMLDDDTALLVDAEDGEHHLRDLGGTWTVGPTLPRLSLSPDGTLLAHAFRNDEGAREDITAGVQVTSLLDGGSTLRELSNDDGDPIAVSSLQWSPDGSWLVWSGAAVDPAEGWVDESPWVGVVEVGADRARQWQVDGAGWNPMVAVSDDGAVAVGANKLWTVEAGTPSGTLPRSAGLPMSEEVAEGSAVLDSAGTVATFPAYTDGNEPLSLDVDLASGEFAADERRWAATEPLPVSSLQIAGHTPDGGIIASVTQPEPTVQRSADHRTVAEILTEVHESDTGYQEVRLTVAFGLGDAAPVAFAQPSWARNRLGWILGLSAPVILVVWLIARRRLRRGATETRTPRAPEGGRTRRLVRSLRGWAQAALLVLVGLTAVVWLRTAGLPGWILFVGLATLVAGSVATMHDWRPGRALFRGAGLTLVLVLTLLYVSHPVWPATPSTPEGGPALPGVVHVPEYDSAAFHASGKPVDQLGVDRASAVVSVSSDMEGAFVLVDAATGRHHLVELPGAGVFLSSDTEAPLALTRDGRRLAWAYADFEADEAGIAFLSLGGGEISRIPLVGRNDSPVRVDELSWSPSGNQLAWWGDEAARWEDDLTAFMGPIRTYGVTATDRPTATFRSVRGNYETPGAITVADSGTGRVLVGKRLLSFTSDEGAESDSRVVSERVLPWSSAVLSPDGETLAIGVNGGLARSDLATGLRTLDLADSGARLALHPWQAPGDGDRVDVLGFSPGGSPVVVHESSKSERTAEIVLVDSTEGRTVSHVGAGSTSSLAVATDLAERAVLQVDEPRWPVSDERWALIGLVAALLAIQLGTTWWRRRQRRSGAA